jgi:hypothetical protein
VTGDCSAAFSGLASAATAHDSGRIVASADDVTTCGQRLQDVAQEMKDA